MRFLYFLKIKNRIMYFKQKQMINASDVVFVVFVWKISHIIKKAFSSFFYFTT